MARIAYFIDTIETAGAGTEKQLLMLLEGLDRRRYDPVLYCLYSSPWLQRHALPCPVEILDVRRLASPALLRAALAFRRHHRERPFDLVQTFFVDANIVGTLLARFCGIGAVISSRRNIGYWQRPLDLRILRLLRRWTRHYLGNSQAALDRTVATEGVDPARMSVIYNGLDTAGLAARAAAEREAMRARLGLEPHHRLVVSVANLRPVKNIAMLVAAAAAVAPEHPEARFAVLGEGDERDDLEERIAAHGLQDVFSLPGSATDVIPWLGAADVAVQCSRSESFSNALVEYMAAGLPTAATAVGGNPEAVDDGRTGLLCPSDDVAALAEALRRLVGDPGAARLMGEAAAADARRRFSVQACIEQTQACYEAVLADQRPAPAPAPERS